MSMSVGQTLPAGAFVRAEAEPGAGKDAPAAGAFADLLAAKAKAGEGKEPAHAEDALPSPVDEEPADEPALAALIRAPRKKNAEPADRRTPDKPAAEEPPQTAREKLPELMSLQQLGAAQGGHGPAGQGRTAADASGAAGPISQSPPRKAAVHAGPEDDAAPPEASGRSIRPEALPTRGALPDRAGPVAPEMPPAEDAGQTVSALLGDGPVAERAAPEPRATVEKHAATGEFTIKAQQSFPAPAPQPVSPTATALAAALDGGLRQAGATPMPSQSGPTVAVPAHILKIELHPAELGSVVANLRLSGQQLSVEIRPETHEAHRRLSADTEALAKSLRSLGFDIESVTVLQPAVATPAAARADGIGALNQAGREQPSFQPGGSDGRGGGQPGQQSGRNPNHDPQEAVRPAAPVRERGGGDLYI